PRHGLAHLQTLVEFLLNLVSPPRHARIGLRPLGISRPIRRIGRLHRVVEIATLLLADEPLHPRVGALGTVKQLDAGLKLCIGFFPWTLLLNRSRLTRSRQLSFQLSVPVRQTLNPLLATSTQRRLMQRFRVVYKIVIAFLF